MRVQLSNGTTQWCAAIPAGGGSIPWSMFKRECWAGGSMEAYSMQAFSKLEIIVPSNSAQPTPFCVCAVSAGVY
jgi:hypothetical protein